jgi:hypothetical protein
VVAVSLFGNPEYAVGGPARLPSHLYCNTLTK